MAINFPSAPTLGDTHVVGNITYTWDEVSWNAASGDSNATIQGNIFNGANQLVQLDGNGKLPAVDGSKITGIGLRWRVLNGTGTIAGNKRYYKICSFPEPAVDMQGTIDFFISGHQPGVPDNGFTTQLKIHLFKNDGEALQVQILEIKKWGELDNGIVSKLDTGIRTLYYVVNNIDADVVGRASYFGDFNVTPITDTYLEDIGTSQGFTTFFPLVDFPSASGYLRAWTTLGEQTFAADIGATIVFNEKELFTNDYWTLTSGVMVPTVDGVYQFTIDFPFYSVVDNKRAKVTARINGVDEDKYTDLLVVGRAAGIPATHSKTFILDLSAGDEVVFHLYPQPSYTVVIGTGTYGGNTNTASVSISKL